MTNPANPKLIISTGMRLGLLQIGDLVLNVQEHPLFSETPISYLQQGKLRACACDCGRVRLFAESILAANRLRSCGCVRAKIRQGAAEGKLDRMTRAVRKQQVTQALQLEQQKLRILQMAPIPRDEKSILECAMKIRSLYAQRRNLTRNKTPSKV